MIDKQPIQLYQEHRAANMDEETLIVESMRALEGNDVQRERALALTYELRDRMKPFHDD